MTKQEKNMFKRLARNLTIYVNIVYVIGALAMIIGTMLILTATQETITGNEVVVFGTGAAIMVIGMILSARTHVKYILPLHAYRNDLLLKKDKHYYNRVCFYAKNNEIDKSMYYHDLLKNSILRDISFGFILGKMYDTEGTQEYNNFIEKYKNKI